MRLSRGTAQVVLAAAVNISPSYLNLIEHNRRKIGGKLLNALARELGVDPVLLSQGAQSDLLELLGQAASGHPDVPVERALTEDMAARFPGWAALIAAQRGQAVSLRRTVESLVDRLTHDTQLAASIHEMLSVVTAIRSTAGILAGGDALEPEWQARFHRNLLEDSKRLAENAQILVTHLAAGDAGAASTEPQLPKEELESWLETQAYHIGALEGGDAVLVDDLLAATPRLTGSVAITDLARRFLDRYRRDAQVVWAPNLQAAMSDAGFDPLQYSQRLGCDLATVLRRVATLPEGAAPAAGLVCCDSSGTLTFCKPMAGFALPRFGAACPLWPLYQALSRPGVPIRAVVELPGHGPSRYLTYAVAQPVASPDFTSAPLYEATMLILPGDGVAGDAQPVGSSCRICARTACRGRREPSILTPGF